MRNDHSKETFEKSLIHPLDSWLKFADLSKKLYTDLDKIPFFFGKCYLLACNTFLVLLTSLIKSNEISLLINKMLIPYTAMFIMFSYTHLVLF